MSKIVDSEVADIRPEDFSGEVVFEDGWIIKETTCIDDFDSLRSLPDGCISLTVTSPPYGDIRECGEHRFVRVTLGRIARILGRLATLGGVVAWVVARAMRA